MNIATEKPWSAAMKIALLALSLTSAAAGVISVVAMIDQRVFKPGALAGAISCGFWAVFTLLLRRHPEWKRFLEEKF